MGRKYRSLLCNIGHLRPLGYNYNYTVSQVSEYPYIQLDRNYNRWNDQKSINETKLLINSLNNIIFWRLSMWAVQSILSYFRVLLCTLLSFYWFYVGIWNTKRMNFQIISMILISEGILNFKWRLIENSWWQMAYSQSHIKHYGIWTLPPTIFIGTPCIRQIESFSFSFAFLSNV